eukprot:CAMPEP_0174257842 /NCGR_PEP_ID=MMETSP0439-20130205/6951_1 /TAXON_ID=0 /ORGANISM="Stereomyxa ramosa, Strain Chinc5" /LENGTH=225 /DNA_ID=CAMNT_0015341121 /DNA_START=92 /DNA_END=766 /DNA_ORIENTATION=+
MDEAIITELKNDCHLDFMNNKDQIFSFYVWQYGKPTLLLHMNVSQPLFITPMSLMHPEVLQVFDKKENRDKIYHQNASSIDLMFPDIMTKSSKTKVPKKDLQKLGKFIGIQEALLESVANIPNKKELRKRVLGAIILCGGTSNINGLRLYLESKLREEVAVRWPEIPRVEVLDCRRKETNLDPCSLAWCGGAIASSLGPASELWFNISNLGNLDETLKRCAPFKW